MNNRFIIENRQVKIPDFILYLLLAAISFTVYFPILSGWYTADDFWHIDSFSFPFAKCIHNILTGHVYLDHADWHYRPVINIILMLIYKSHLPILGHILSVILHVTVAILLFNFVKVIFDNRQSAIAAALIFILHPAAAPAVSWIASFGDLLTTGLALCAALCFVSTNRNTFKFVLTIIFFAIALLTKEMCATLPILLAILSYYKKNLRKDVVLILSIFVALILFVILRNSIVGNPLASSGTNAFVSFSYRTIIAIIRYISQLVIPMPTHLLITKPVSIIAIVPLLFILVLWSVRKGISTSIRFYVIASGTIIISLLPVINLFSSWYQYFPSAIFAILASYLFCDKLKKLFIAITVLWLIILGINTFFVAKEWKNCSIYEKKLIALISKIPEDKISFGNFPLGSCEDAIVGDGVQVKAALSQFYGQKNKQITIFAPLVVEKIWGNPVLHTLNGTNFTCYSPAGKTNYYPSVRFNVDTAIAKVTFSNFTGILGRPKTDQITFKKETKLYEIVSE